MAKHLYQLREQVTSIWGEEHDPRLEVDECVNEAGRHLYTMHQWNFRNRPPATLAFVADQEYVALPADFGELLALATSDGLNQAVQLTSLEQIIQMRTATVGSPGSYWAAVVQPTQTPADDPDPAEAMGVPRLEIYPTPIEDLADAFTLAYRATWIEMSDARAPANVPAWADGLLVDLVRAFAHKYRFNTLAPLEAIEQSAYLHRLKSNDGLTQQNYGPMLGGANQQASQGLNFNPVADPN